jgi:hypothetical protein
LQVSPNGLKLYVENYIPRPTIQFQVGSTGILTIDPGSSPTFRIAVGKFGDYLGGIYTSPIPYDADAETVWNQVRTAGTAVWEFAYGADTAILEDPRDSGLPYAPYGGGPLPTNPVFCQFKVNPEHSPEGGWFDIDTHYLVGDGLLSYYLQLTAGFGDTIPSQMKRYLCNPDGSALTAIDFGDVEFSVGPIWSPDSTKIHGICTSSDSPTSWVYLSGSSTDLKKHYARWFVYDVASGDISFPLDYSSEASSSSNGPLTGEPPWISPNGEKVIWKLSHSDGSSDLLIGNFDGSTVTSIATLYHRNSGADSSDQDLTFMSNFAAWSFDSTKFAMVDSRDPAPVWVFNVATGAREKAFAGTGWDNPDDQKWIYDILGFNA